MTRAQYFEMAENFAKYAGREVEYKSLNLHPTLEDAKKYHIKTATLWGVGLQGNLEHFILTKPLFGHMAIHYSKIKYPDVEGNVQMEVTDETEWADVDNFVHKNVRGGSVIMVK